jgi:hypothetical protein
VYNRILAGMFVCFISMFSAAVAVASSRRQKGGV